jgi:hypothetical protein
MTERAKPQRPAAGERGRRYDSLADLLAAVRDRCARDYETRMGKAFTMPEDNWVKRPTPSAAEMRARQVYEELRRAYRKAKRINERIEAEAEKEAPKGRRRSPTETWLASWVRRVDQHASGHWREWGGKRTSLDFDRAPWDDRTRYLTGRARLAFQLCLLAKVRVGRGTFGVFKDRNELRSFIPLPDRDIAVYSFLCGNTPERVTKRYTVAEVLVAETKAMRRALAREMENRTWFDVDEDAAYEASVGK